MEEINVPSNSTDIGALETSKLTGWASFIAILTIIGGAITCIGIITAAVGIPMIIAGIKLLNAVDNMKTFSGTKDPQKVAEAFENLNKYFKINGIVFVVVLSLEVLVILLSLIIGFTLLPSIPR